MPASPQFHKESGMKARVKGKKNPLISERMLAAHRKTAQHLMRKSVKKFSPHFFFPPTNVLTYKWSQNAAVVEASAVMAEKKLF
jgi:hypothetical protein